MVRYPDVVPPSNGFLVGGSCNPTYGSRCEVGCNLGYGLSQNSSFMECTADDDVPCDGGIWSGSPTCIGKVF